MNSVQNKDAWAAVIDFAQQNQCDWGSDPADDAQNWGIHRADTPPHDRLLGPVFARGPASGLIRVGGVDRCAWGDPDRADMTFSVTKTYLALTAGIAFDQGLLGDPHKPVCERLPNLGFNDPHNRQVTWAQLLQFTSEWQGTCFGVPDQVDRYRRAGFQEDPPPGAPAKGEARTLQTPGTFWEYNDVRINQFSLALMHLFKRPLPEVFDEFIMTPLGASKTWQWHGYENSWMEIDGKQMQSVPGGGHWGGGAQISARDQVLVGQLILNRGQHGNQQLISEQWIQQMLTPCPIAPFYGYFTWLNQGDKPISNAPRESFFGLGIGGQVIWHDPTRDLVAAIRWSDTARLNELIDRINHALATDDS